MAFDLAFVAHRFGRVWLLCSALMLGMSCSSAGDGNTGKRAADQPGKNTSTTQTGTAGFAGVEVDVLDGATFAAERLARDSATVLWVLSPECPLCLDYAHTFRLLADSFSAQGIRVYGIFPGTFFSEDEIRHYLRRFRLTFPVLLDPDYALVHQLGADTTPEAILLDAKGQTVYQGAIDNWAVEVSRKRLQATRHYLRDAVAAFGEGRVPDPARTAAVGCLIE